MDMALGIAKLMVALAPAIILQVQHYRRFRKELEADPRPDWLKEGSWIVSRSRKPRNPPFLVFLGLLARFLFIIFLPFP